MNIIQPVNTKKLFNFQITIRLPSTHNANIQKKSEKTKFIRYLF